MRAEHDAPYWCEENAWHLCADARLASHRVDVIVVSNPARQVALFHQRAAPHPAAPVVWDYHVLLGSRDDQGRTWIWDLDTRLEFPADSRAWLHATVRALPFTAPDTDDGGAMPTEPDPPPPDEPPSQEPSGCGEVDYAGRCDDATLVWCEDEVLRSYDCGAVGMTCGWQDDVVGNNCL